MKDYLLSYANRDLPAFNKEYQVAIEAGRKQSNNEGFEGNGTTVSPIIQHSRHSAKYYRYNKIYKHFCDHMSHRGQKID